MRDVVVAIVLAAALIWAGHGSDKNQDRVAATLESPGTIVVQRADVRSTVAIKAPAAYRVITASTEPSMADMAAFDFMRATGQVDTGLPDH